jgi:dCTP diphosphatase
MDLQKIERQLAGFAEERDWDQFHSAKNLAMALVAEGGELLELFQWLSEEQSDAMGPDHPDHHRVCEELADIQIYLIRMATRLNVDLERAVADKMVINERKYPAELARGNSIKYDRLKYDQPKHDRRQK